MRKSMGSTNPRGAMKVKGGLASPEVGSRLSGLGAPPARLGVSPLRRPQAELERTRWDPKDGELCLSRLKPGETLVEDRSDSDVQIDRPTWV